MRVPDFAHMINSYLKITNTTKDNNIAHFSNQLINYVTVHTYCIYVCVSEEVEQIPGILF